MKILIIYGHPETGVVGFAEEYLADVKKILIKKEVAFEVLDLYEINYNPVMKPEELYTAGNKFISPENMEIQQKIKQANGLIFIYPVWWGGMPAIMKGFMDRVFTPGFAFKYRKDKLLNFVPDKLLNDKKVLALTSLGGPWFVYKLILNPIALINKLVIFGLFCSKIKTLQIFSANRLTDKKIKEVNHITKKGIKWLLNN